MTTFARGGRLYSFEPDQPGKLHGTLTVNGLGMFMSLQNHRALVAERLAAGDEDLARAIRCELVCLKRRVEAEA